MGNTGYSFILSVLAPSVSHGEGSKYGVNVGKVVEMEYLHAMSTDDMNGSYQDTLYSGVGVRQLHRQYHMIFNTSHILCSTNLASCFKWIIIGVARPFFADWMRSR